MKVIESNAHDACITWIAGNGTILLQNVVRKNEECITSRINFWKNFINMYYRGSGSTVVCCEGNGCNNGAQSHSRRNNGNNHRNRLQFGISGTRDSTEIHDTGNILQNCKIPKFSV